MRERLLEQTANAEGWSNFESSCKSTPSPISGYFHASSRPTVVTSPELLVHSSFVLLTMFYRYIHVRDLHSPELQLLGHQGRISFHGASTCVSAAGPAYKCPRSVPADVGQYLSLLRGIKSRHRYQS